MTEETYKDYMKRIKRWAWKKKIYDVEDLFHDAYIKYLNQPDPNAISISWFYRVIENAHYTRHRKSTSKMYQDDFAIGKKIFYSKRPNTREDWEDIYESAANVRNKLDDMLTEEQRYVIFSHYLGKRKRKDIAKELGYSLSGIGNLIHRPLKEFKECMSDETQDNSPTKEE